MSWSTSPQAGCGRPRAKARRAPTSDRCGCARSPIPASTTTQRCGCRAASPGGGLILAAGREPGHGRLGNRDVRRSGCGPDQPAQRWEPGWHHRHRAVRDPVRPRSGSPPPRRQVSNRGTIDKMAAPRERERRCLGPVAGFGGLRGRVRHRDRHQARRMSGAVFLLPVQMSVLGSPTRRSRSPNLLYN